MATSQDANLLPEITVSSYSFRAESSTAVASKADELTLETEIRTEWIGTSQFFTKENVNLQKSGHLNALINYRKSIADKIVTEPYNPSHYIDLSRCDTKLGFSDIATANAHRALILIEAALGQRSKYFDAHTFLLPVQNIICNTLRTRSPTIVYDELQDIYLKAYRELLIGLLDTAAFWDGLKEGKKALKKNMFPNDMELLETYQLLKIGFINRHKDLKKEGADGCDIVVKSRMGKVYCKRYPWLAKELYFRTPDLITDVNKTLGGSCTIKPVVFGPSSGVAAVKLIESEDLGPLGLFATRRIKENEVVLVDTSLTGISDVPSSYMDYCDACHASLVFPFLLELKDIRKPSCCGRVAFCSKECYEQATEGYHSTVCGQDFQWLYRDINETSQMYTRWRPIMFLRIVSVIIADRRATPRGQRPVHPLQHPIMAVMTANYAPKEMLQPRYTSDWQFFEVIQAPTRILLQLGVDIFADPDFSPEVIQTMYYRMENNSNMSSFNPRFATECFGIPTVDPSKPYDPSDETPQVDGTVHMYSLNTRYLFINHSCDPNMSWHGCSPTPDDDIEDYKDLNGKMLKMGSSTVICKAARDIRKGEELKISYIGDPLCKQGEAEVTEEMRAVRRATKRLWMTKWFEGGCGCIYCEQENADKPARLEPVNDISIDAAGAAQDPIVVEKGAESESIEVHVARKLMAEENTT